MGGEIYEIFIKKFIDYEKAIVSILKKLSNTSQEVFDKLR